MVDKSPVLQPHASHDATNPQTNTCYPISADLIRMAIVATAFSPATMASWPPKSDSK